MSRPLVSIIMPMLNAEAFVFQAAQSVLSQQDVAVELIIVDDGSTDHSAARIGKFKTSNIKLVTGQGKGVAAAFNVGLGHATGEYLARCDADDVYVPGRLARQLRWLETHPEFGAICGGFATMTEAGSFIRDMHCGAEAEEITAELAAGDTRTSFCTWLTRTSLVRMAGGCREYFRLAEDIDLQLRLCEFGRTWFEPGRCYRYRLHDASATHSSHTELRLFFDGIARQFAEQRQATGRMTWSAAQRRRRPMWIRSVTMDHGSTSRICCWALPGTSFLTAIPFVQFELDCAPV
jgi:glycosyltransferase involved in cell wall biosynthesis